MWPKVTKIKCPSCSKEISRTNFSKHIKLHSAIRFHFSFCPKRFKGEAKKEKHIEIHSKQSTSKDKGDKDDEAEMETTDVEDSKEMPPVLKIRKCKICQSQLSSLTDLTRHIYEN